MQELDPRTVRAQSIAVCALERRTAHHTAVLVILQPLPHRFQPGIAVGIGQRRARRHLRDVGCRVKGTRRRRANAAPTVDLPDPETPMTTMGTLEGQAFSGQITVPL